MFGIYRESTWNVVKNLPEMPRQHNMNVSHYNNIKVHPLKEKIIIIITNSPRRHSKFSRAIEVLLLKEKVYALFSLQDYTVKGSHKTALNVIHIHFLDVIHTCTPYLIFYVHRLTRSIMDDIKSCT